MQRFITLLAVITLLALPIGASAHPGADKVGPHGPPPHHGPACPCANGHEPGCPCHMHDHGPHHGAPHGHGPHQFPMPPMGPMSRIAHLVKELNLSADQESSIKKLMADCQKKMENSREDKKKAFDELMAAESTLPLNKANIKAAQNKLDQLLKEERNLRLDMDIEIVRLLNAVQKEILAKKLAEKPEPCKCQLMAHNHHGANNAPCDCGPDKKHH